MAASSDPLAIANLIAAVAAAGLAAAGLAYQVLKDWKEGRPQLFVVVERREPADVLVAGIQSREAGRGTWFATGASLVGPRSLVIALQSQVRVFTRSVHFEPRVEVQRNAGVILLDGKLLEGEVYPGMEVALDVQVERLDGVRAVIRAKGVAPHLS